MAAPAAAPVPAYPHFLRPAAQWKPYTQPEPPGAEFWQVLDKGEIPDLSIGKVRLTGPIHKTPAAHADWEQVYLILAGQGTMHLGTESKPINGPAVIVIPRYTHHSVEVALGQTLDYYYINQYTAPTSR